MVVGTDYSPLALTALERALALTAPGGDVQVVHAWTAPVVGHDLDGGLLQQLRDAAARQAAVERARLLTGTRPPDVTVRVELGDGAPLTLLEARSEAADLVVVGTHGRSGLRRFLLGSVAKATIRHARCSVLVAC